MKKIIAFVLIASVTAALSPVWAKAAQPLSGMPQIAAIFKLDYDADPERLEWLGSYEYQFAKGTLTEGEIFTNQISNDIKAVLPYSIRTQAAIYPDGLVEYTVSITSLDDYQAARERAVKILDAIISGGMTDYDKVTAMHNYLKDNCKFDSAAAKTVKKSSKVLRAQTSFGALIDRKAVCTGYSDALMLLCQMEKIPCMMISGEYNGEGHSWNVVYIGGKWRHIDVTLDDSPASGGGNAYLLLDDDTMSADHTFDRGRILRLADLLVTERSIDLQKLLGAGITDKSVSLEPNAAVTRVQAVVMLARLAGYEKQILSKPEHYSTLHPFTDVPDYAAPYAGYLYGSGIVNGVSPTLFGADRAITIDQCLTLLLRIMGYKDGEDFQLRESGEFALELGIISETRLDASKYREFLGGDVAAIFSKILDANRNVGVESQLEKTDGLKFTKKHEWVRAEGNKAYIGLTNEGQTLFGTILFISIPKVGSVYMAGDAVGAVESMKATAKFHTPVSGTVTDSNRNLIVDPELVNKAPYDNWFAVLEMSDSSELDGMMDHAAYDKFCRAGGKE